jgi:hypothetical protein
MNTIVERIADFFKRILAIWSFDISRLSEIALFV